jgi:pathogenesis-related protein 1
MKKIIGLIAIIGALGFLPACSVTEKQEVPAEEMNQVEVPDNQGLPSTHETKDKWEHTHVILPPIQQPAEPVWKERPALSNKVRFAGALQVHNQIRAKHRLPSLKWSNRLANYSQQWANQLGRGSHCQMYHRSGNVKFGENLYRSTAIVWTDGKREINPVTIKQVVKAWTDEKRWYNYRGNSCQPGQQCGHYKQVVWKNTKEVGCAMKVCGDKSQVWVCSYNPAGNYTGQRPY